MKFLFGDGDRLAAYAAPAAERASLWRIPAALVLFILLMLGGGMLIGLALTQLAPGWNPAGIAGDLSSVLVGHQGVYSEHFRVVTSGTGDL